MKTQSSDIADFYQQLALLIRSNLPLPESLKQLGQNFQKPEFKALLLRIGDRAARGEKLSQAIRGYPQFFHPLHIRLIAAGEATGTLPETLFAVARFARFCQLVASRMRDIVAYPFLTMHLCLIVVLYISVMVIPRFKEMFDDMFIVNLPPLTEGILTVGMFIHDYWSFHMAAYVLLLGVTIWLFSSGLSAHRALLAIINVMPGSLKIVHSLDSARLCTLWSTFIRHRMPLHDVMETSAQLVDRFPLQNALQRVAQKIQSGEKIIEALATESAVDPLILLTFRHTAEEELPDELAQLGELYEHRVTLAVRSASVMWTIISFMMTTLVVSTVVFAMFLPLISMVQMMAG